MPDAWDPRTLPTAFWLLVGFVALYMGGAVIVARWTEAKQRKLIPGLTQLEQEILDTWPCEDLAFPTDQRDFAAAVERLREMGLIE